MSAEGKRDVMALALSERQLLTLLRERGADCGEILAFIAFVDELNDVETLEHAGLASCHDSWLNLIEWVYEAAARVLRSDRSFDSRHPELVGTEGWRKAKQIHAAQRNIDGLLFRADVATRWAEWLHRLQDERYWRKESKR